MAIFEYWKGKMIEEKILEAKRHSVKHSDFAFDQYTEKQYEPVQI